MQAKLVARHQPIALAAMEGRFESGPRAGLNLIGQPNVAERRIDNPIAVPGAPQLPRVRARHERACKGLNDFPESDWPDNIELLYYSFHVMAGLGTLLIARDGARELPRVAQEAGAVGARMLWILMLSFPFPYIARPRGLDDGRARAAAVARLRPHAHGGRLEPERERRDGALHADRLLRHLHGPRAPLPLPRRARDRARAARPRGSEEVAHA